MTCFFVNPQLAMNVSCYYVCDSREAEHPELIKKILVGLTEPLPLKNEKHFFLLINIMHCGVTDNHFVGYLAALKADHQIINALIQVIYRNIWHGNKCPSYFANNELKSTSKIDFTQTLAKKSFR